SARERSSKSLSFSKPGGLRQIRSPLMKNLLLAMCLFACPHLFAQQSNTATPTTEDRVKALEDRIIAREGTLRVMQNNQQQAGAAAPTANVSQTAPPTTPVEPA